MYFLAGGWQALMGGFAPLRVSGLPGPAIIEGARFFVPPRDAAGSSECKLAAQRAGRNEICVPGPAFVSGGLRLPRKKPANGAGPGQCMETPNLTPGIRFVRRTAAADLTGQVSSVMRFQFENRQIR
jgi:hypothetical protein